MHHTHKPIFQATIQHQPNAWPLLVSVGKMGLPELLAQAAQLSEKRKRLLNQLTIVDSEILETNEQVHTTFVLPFRILTSFLHRFGWPASKRSRCPRRPSLPLTLPHASPLLSPAPRLTCACCFDVSPHVSSAARARLFGGGTLAARHQPDAIVGVEDLD